MLGRRGADRLGDHRAGRAPIQRGAAHTVGLLETQSGWLTNANPSKGGQMYPMGFVREGWDGLTAQAMWGRRRAQRRILRLALRHALGFSAWRMGSYVQFNSTLNAGTAGVQRALASSQTYADFEQSWTTSSRPTSDCGAIPLLTALSRCCHRKERRSISRCPGQRERRGVLHRRTPRRLG